MLASCSHFGFNKLKPVSNKYGLSTESSLENSVHIYKIDSLYDLGVDGYFNGADSVKIYYKYFRRNRLEKGAIVISAGRTETAYFILCRR